MKKFLLSLSSFAALSALAAGSVVKITGSEGSWGLTFNGKPYFVNGGGGGGSKALLKEIGGNSFRTWGANAAKKDLDEAAKYGETVTIGFWLGRRYCLLEGVSHKPGCVAHGGKDIVVLVRIVSGKLERCPSGLYRAEHIHKGESVLFCVLTHESKDLRQVHAVSNKLRE